MEVIKLNVVNPKDSISTLGFTNDQSKAYDALIKFINSDYDEEDYKRALIGPAGTGKTYLVKALIKNCNLSFSTIGLAAPTHKACRVLHESINLSNITVNTLQSDLGLRLNFDIEKFDINNPPFDPKGKIKINGYKIYIVDESSMINRGLCTFLEKVCKTNKCKILYIGDDAQLAPVGEYYSPALRGVESYRLNEIVRQEEDNPVRPLLEILRKDIRNKTYNFLNHIARNKEQFDESYIKGYKVCGANEFQQIMYRNFSDDALTKNVDYAKVIAFTNLAVSSWNKYIRGLIIKDADKSVLTKHDLIISYATLVNQFNEPIIKNSEDYIINDIVNYVHPQYGFKGFMVKFTAIHGGHTSQPLFIIDHTDQVSIMKYVEMSKSLINDAKTCNVKLRPQKWKDFYQFKEGVLLLTNIIDRMGNSIAGRSLDYGFALTSHKSQGSTFDTVFVDVNDIVFDKHGRPYRNAEEVNRRLYVACSRCRNKLYLRYGS